MTLTLPLCSQSLLAPVSAFTILLIVVAAPCFLPEKITKTDIVAVVLIVTGSVVTTVFGAHSQQIFDIPALLASYRRPELVVFQVFVLFSIVGLLMWIRFSPDPFLVGPASAQDQDSSTADGKADAENAENGAGAGAEDGTGGATPAPASPAPPPPSSSASSGSHRSSAAPAVKCMSRTAYSGVDGSLPRRWYHLPHRWVPFAHGTVTALTGAEQIVFTKTFAELAVLSINGYTQLHYVFTWFVLLLAIALALFQMWFLSSGAFDFDEQCIVAIVVVRVAFGVVVAE